MWRFGTPENRGPERAQSQRSCAHAVGRVKYLPQVHTKTKMASPFNILSNSPATPPPAAHPRPPWLRVKFFGGPNYQELKRIMRTLDLHTVCESARCPNMGECWEHRTATFMILGNICTRACGFCAVPSGKPLGPPEEDEPERVAEAVERMGLALCGRHVRESRRPARWRRIHFRAHDRANSRARSRLPRRSADPGFSRRLECTRNSDGSAPRRAEPQYGNGAASLPPRAQGRRVRALARIVAARWRNVPRNLDENRNDAGTRRNARRSSERDGRNRRAGHAHPHARPIPAAYARAPADRALSSIPTNLPNSSASASRWDSSTWKQARSSARPITPSSRKNPHAVNLFSPLVEFLPARIILPR